MPYTVTARQVCKSFGDAHVLDHVDLDIGTGSVLALLGPNGAGKTTMVRILATLLRPDAGAVTIAGHDLRSDPVGIKRSISLTGQHAAIDDVLTGKENLEMMAQLLHLPRRAASQRAEELLREFDLVDARDRRVRTYSGGMTRRLDLAISMIKRPMLMLLDEPTTGLDPRSREQVWRTVRTIVDDGVTVLLTTQYLEEADHLADAIVMLDRGRVVARGTPDELKARLGSEVVRLQFVDDASYSAAVSSLRDARSDDRLRTIEVATDGTTNEVRELLERLGNSGASAPKISTHRPSLDDVFLSLTARDATQPIMTEVSR
jgi:ABC-2 type transport system ATP-binding protein